MKKIVHNTIEFTYPMRKSVQVPVEIAFDWYEKQELSWEASKVHWHYEGEEEMFWSFAKSWTFWDGSVHQLMTVGSGAYGDSTVISRTVARVVATARNKREKEKCIV